MITQKCVQCSTPDPGLHLFWGITSGEAVDGDQYEGGSFCSEGCLAAYIGDNPGDIDARHRIVGKVEA